MYPYNQNWKRYSCGYSKHVYTKNAMLLKKPKRETVISKDDIVNLKIAMNTMNFEMFIEKM